MIDNKNYIRDIICAEEKCFHEKDSNNRFFHQHILKKRKLLVEFLKFLKSPPPSPFWRWERASRILLYRHDFFTIHVHYISTLYERIRWSNNARQQIFFWTFCEYFFSWSFRKFSDWWKQWLKESQKWQLDVLYDTNTNLAILLNQCLDTGNYRANWKCLLS